MGQQGRSCEPASAGEALAAIEAGLAYLNSADIASLTTAEQAGCLRALERVAAAHTAARSRVLAAFTARHGYASDGQFAPRTWLKWQTKVTDGAAAGAVGWMRRLAAHPAVREALAAGKVSASWAKDVCAWAELLPEEHREDAEEILLAAAEGGASHLDLRRFAEEMHARCARPDEDHARMLDDRNVRLDVTFGGTGRLTGDLTPACTAALGAALEALSKKAGPEDTRTAPQRRHDALEEACHRLLAAGSLPGRAGQPTQAVVHMSLSQLRAMPGGAEAEAAWIAARAGEPGRLAGPAARAAACDTTVVPVVTGHLDRRALDQLTDALLAARPSPREELRRALLAMAIEVVSGPGGLAATLRQGLLEGPVSAASLPLDAGLASPTIPAHLRRAVILRDRHCAFPGCHQAPAVCQVHHLLPRAEGGPATLRNLILLCRFHHLIAVHEWGWRLVLHPDASVTAIGPDGRRVLRSHGPPATAA